MRLPQSGFVQTLVLYRMRPIRRAQVGSGRGAGRVRNNCLKEAARGEALCKFNGVGIIKRFRGQVEEQEKSADRIVLFVVCIGEK
jgi:hypothetical protein